MSVADFTPFDVGSFAPPAAAGETVAGSVAGPLLTAEDLDEGPKMAENRHSSTALTGTVATVAGLAGVPELSPGWQAALRKLATARPFGPADRWRQINEDAQALAARWGSVASGFGWDLVQVFGWHPEYDDVGLVVQLRGRPVIAMTEGEAIIRLQPRGWRILRPRFEEGMVLLWRWEEYDPP